MATKKANNTKSTSRNKTGGASRAKANNSSASKAKQNQKNKKFGTGQRALCAYRKGHKTKK